MSYLHKIFSFLLHSTLSKFKYSFHYTIFLFFIFFFRDFHRLHHAILASYTLPPPSLYVIQGFILPTTNIEGEITPNLGQISNCYPRTRDYFSRKQLNITFFLIALYIKYIIHYIILNT